MIFIHSCLGISSRAILQGDIHWYSLAASYSFVALYKYINIITCNLKNMTQTVMYVNEN